MQRSLSVHIVKQGLQSGLTKFFGRATRVALIYCAHPAVSNDFFVYDTTNLLSNHKEAIREYFAGATAVPNKTTINSPDECIQLSPQISEGLYCLLYQSQSMFFHLWFIERPQTESPISLLEQWIKFAQLPLLRRDEEMNINTQIGAGRLAEHAAFDVIREVIMEQMFPRTLAGGQADAENVLESLLEIATVKEEGSGCTGTLAIYDQNPHRQPTVDYPLRAPVNIDKFKHVRKFLTATSEDYQLVAVAGSIVGFSHKNSLACPLLAEFDKGKLTLSLKNIPLCQVTNGTFKAIESKWSLDIQKQTKSLSRLDSSFKSHIQQTINTLVTTARNEHFGCTLLLDSSGDFDNRGLSGQQLEQRVPLNSDTFKLFADMCRVDGAVHVDVRTLSICAFACLLDGESGEKEELSRGARFNSAQRYSRKTDNMVVLVVSEDGPVTVFENGKTAAAIEKYIRDQECKHSPPRLSEWLLVAGR